MSESAPPNPALPPGDFVSYAQNAEDVVIWRALGDVENGRYVDVGAAHPIIDSVTKALYVRGWSGIDVEPMAEYADALRADRPRDTVVEAAAGSEAGMIKLFAIPGTGLSSTVQVAANAACASGYDTSEMVVPVRTLSQILDVSMSPGDELHLLKVDVEGAEEAALQGLDFGRWAPWLVVVEATRPNSVESTRDQFEYLLSENGYTPVLFDGLNVFYLSPNHRELAAKLSYPACPLDQYVRHDRIDDMERYNSKLAASQHDTDAWRAAWSQAIGEDAEARRALAIAQREGLEAKNRALAANRQLGAMQSSPWWRVTRPGRGVVHRLKSMKSAAPPDPAQAHTSPTKNRALPANPAEALQGRLATVISEFLDGISESTPIADLLNHAAALFDSESRTEPGFLWLMNIAFLARFPTDADIELLETDLLLLGAPRVVADLAKAATALNPTWAAHANIELVTRPFIDVTNTANNEIHTGIQRVVREVVPRWAKRNDIQIAAFHTAAGCWTTLNTAQANRIFRWGEPPVGDPTGRPATILVPWRTTFIVPELSGEAERQGQLKAIAKHSGSELSITCFDLIPYAMPDSCRDEMHTFYARYMSVVRLSTRVSTISRAVERDLLGLSQTFANQGIDGPSVAANPLPVHGREVSPGVINRQAPDILGAPGLPLVLSVSSIEPRKNHLRVLLAAEQLWREGHAFQLLFIAGSGWKRETFDHALGLAQASGRPVRVLDLASDETLWAAYKLARFTVFASITEGFGLPAGESISLGTPVVLSNTGPMVEVGAGGGAEFVDPHSLESITHGMRRLLTDDDHLAVLRRECEELSLPTWDDYAVESWAWLADGMRPS